MEIGRRPSIDLAQSAGTSCLLSITEYPQRAFWVPLATEIARRAREIIHDPATWTSTASARDESAAAVSPLSPQATKFCGLGALVRAAHELGYSERWLVDIFGASPLGDLVRSHHLGDAMVLSNLAKLGSEASGSGTTTRRLR